MSKYYVLPINADITALSMANADYDVTFSITIPGNEDVLSVVEQGDFIVVYKKTPEHKTSYVLEKASNRLYKKVVEVKNGVDIANIVGTDLETSNILEIDEEKYNRILSALFSAQFIGGQPPADEDDDTTFTDGENILFYGVPGSGKSHAIKEICDDANYMTRVVFHPEYTYSDFTGQIMPRIEYVDGEEKLKYAFVPGPFTVSLKNAIAHPENKYYLVIEEINRGNAPAIFGEIFQLLDRDSNGRSEYGITNFDIAKVIYGEEHANCQIRIPGNLTILATMNTSDQNVFTLDTAFQRRWQMRHIPNVFNEETDRELDGTDVKWNAFATTVNDMIMSADYIVSSGDKRLGAFFVIERETRKERFAEKVLKYLWDDAFKMNRDALFKDEYKTIDEIIENYEGTSDDEDALRTVIRNDVFDQMVAASEEETEEE